MITTMPPPARRRILVVEDDPSTREALASWLTYEYDVVTACDGLQGLELATTMDPGPDVILADVWMPRLDGISMVVRIKSLASLRHVPVIFLTGQVAPRSMIAGISAGARAYLPKPVDLDVLDRKLQSALRGGPSMRP